MKKIIFFLTAVLFYTNSIIAYAQYTNQSWINDLGVHCYNAIAINNFYEHSGGDIIGVTIGIEKVNFKSNGFNMYVYAINIAQPLNQTPFVPSKIVIASDTDSVAIDVYNPRIDRGQHTLIYKVFSYELAKINTLVLNSHNSILISVMDTQNRIHNFFTSDDYLREIKLVANWS